MSSWLRREDLNLCPSGYEPDELPAAPLRDIKLVPGTGVEPVRDKISRDFKSRASANSATPAQIKMAPRVGLEPTAYRLTAECSTIELPWNILLKGATVQRQELLYATTFEMSIRNLKFLKLFFQFFQSFQQQTNPRILP